MEDAKKIDDKRYKIEDIRSKIDENRWRNEAKQKDVEDERWMINPYPGGGACWRWK